jgi:AAA domain
VDRVLIGLLEHGCTDFIRVGSRRRIAKELLRYSLSASSSIESQARSRADAARECHAMLADRQLSREHRALVQAELNAVSRPDVLRRRMEQIASAPIVGVTCASVASPALQLAGSQFGIVLLDEATQMPEPLALLPLSLGCRHLVCAYIVGLCVHVCVSVYMRVCVYERYGPLVWRCVHEQMRMRERERVCVYTHPTTILRQHVGTNVCGCTPTGGYLQACIYVCVCVCVCGVGYMCLTRFCIVPATLDVLR